MVSFDLGVVQFYAPATVFICAATYLLTDAMNEGFGIRETQRRILRSFAS